jgi:hypothetical protein
MPQSLIQSPRGRLSPGNRLQINSFQRVDR